MFLNHRDYCHTGFSCVFAGDEEVDLDEEKGPLFHQGGGSVSVFRGDLDSSTSTPYHARCYLVSAAGAYKEAEYGVVTRELFTT